MGWSSEQREQERLLGLYGEMSDGELLGLFASRGDLTEVAQTALEGEMKRRLLEPPAADDEAPIPESGGGTDEGWKTLHVFAQPFEAQAAFRLMEREEIPFAVEDRTIDEHGRPVPGPSVQLALMVAEEDWPRSVVMLRKEAGLFPEPVVGERGDEIDADAEIWSVVGDFEEEAELERAGQRIAESGLELRVIRGEWAGGDAGSIEVREADAEKAIAVLERLIAEERE